MPRNMAEERGREAVTRYYDFMSAESFVLTAWWRAPVGTCP